MTSEGGENIAKGGGVKRESSQSSFLSHNNKKCDIFYPAKQARVVSLINLE